MLFKNKQRIIFLVTFLLISSLSISTFLASSLGFNTEKLSTQDEAKEIEQFELVKTNEMAQSNQIHTFAVNERGQVAVGFYNKSAINIFSRDGSYLYTYLFNERDKRAYSVEWDEESLVIIIWGHDKRFISINTETNSVDIQKIPMTDEFNSYLVNIHNTTSKEINGITYKMCNAMEGPLSLVPNYYTQVVKEEAGEQSIIIDVTSSASRDTIVLIVGMIALIVFLAIFLPIMIKRKIKNGVNNTFR